MRSASALQCFAIFLFTGIGGVEACAGTTNWKIDEVFSNIDGSVQFIELFTSLNGQNQLHSSNLPNGQTLASGSNTFSFPTDLPSTQTANHHLLIATPGYAALPHAPKADYVLPANFFFDPVNDTLTFAGKDSLQFFEELLPRDGVNALFGDGTTHQNIATNFSGASGSVSLGSSVPLPPAIWAAAPLLLLLAGSRFIGFKATSNAPRP